MGQTASSERQLIETVIKLPSRQTWDYAEIKTILVEFQSLLVRYQESENAFGMLERREITKASAAVFEILRKLIAIPGDSSTADNQELTPRHVLLTLFHCFRFTFVAKKLLPQSLEILHSVLRSNMRQAALCVCLILTSFNAMDDNSKLQLCVQIDAVGLHQCMVDVLTFCAAHINGESNTDIDWTAFALLQYLNWIVQSQKMGLDFVSARVQSHILQQRDALFELTRHSLLVVNHEASKLLCNILVAEESSSCRVAQVAARSDGVLLWQLVRCVSLILRLRNVPRPTSDSAEDYPMLSVNVPATPEGLTSMNIVCPSFQDALMIAEDALIFLSVGSQANAQVVLLALPDAMTLYLVQKPQRLANKSTSEPRTDRFASYAEKMSSSGNWPQLILSLKEDTFTPRLVWNESTLTHLYRSLEAASRKFEASRALRHVPWESESFEVSYPMYKDLLCVRGFFLPALIRELENGLSVHLSDPVKMTWSIHDHLNSEEDETNKTLCMRLLRLLLFRYSNLLADSLPIGVLTQMLIAATTYLKTGAAADGVQGPRFQWLGECIHLLRERLVNAARQDMMDFIHMNGLFTLVDLLSTYSSVVALSKTVDTQIEFVRGTTESGAEDDDEDDADGDDGDDEDDATGSKNESSASKTTNSMKRTVYVSCGEVIRVLVDASAAAAQILASPECIEQLIRAVWLLSPNGPLEPAGQPRAIAQIALTIRRVLHVSPHLTSQIDTMRLVSVLAAASVQRSGAGVLMPETATLLYEIRSIVNESSEILNGTHTSGQPQSGHLVIKRLPPPSADELRHLRKVFPIQLISLATLMKPDAFTGLFNANVTSSDVLWNTEMRRHCSAGLNHLLRPWLSTFTPVEVGEEEAPTCVRYPPLDEQPQVAGIYLRGFLTAQPNAFVMPFDVQHFAQEIFHTIRKNIPVDCVSPSADAKRGREADSTTSLGTLSVEERPVLLGLAVSQLLKHFPLAEELWSNDGIIAICNAIQASMQQMEHPGAHQAQGCDVATVWQWYGVSANVCVLLRSLSAKFTIDASPAKTRATVFTQNLREFRRTQQGFAQVFEHVAEVLTPALRYCASFLDSYTSEQPHPVILACDLFMTAAASFVCTVLRRCVSTCDDEDGSASNAANVLEVKSIFRVIQETAVLRELIKLCDSRIAALCPRGTYCVVVTLRRLMRISPEHTADAKQLLLDGGALILGLDAVISLIIEREENRGCLGSSREAAKVDTNDKSPIDRSKPTDLKTSLEEDAIDLQCIQACADVESILQKFLLDFEVATPHTPDSSMWPSDFKPILVREGVLFLREFMKTNDGPVEEAEPTSKPSTQPTSAQDLATAVLNQLLTPPIAGLLARAAGTFGEVICASHVRRPVAFWDTSMLDTLKQVLSNELHRIHSAFGFDHWPAWNPQELIVREGYKSHYQTIADEVLVDNLYISALLDPANFQDIGSEPIGELVHSLQASIQSSRRILQHLTAANKTGRNSAAASVTSALSLKERVLAGILKKHPECDWQGNYNDTD